MLNARVRGAEGELGQCKTTILKKEYQDVKKKQATATQRRIDGVTYIVAAAPGADARERLDAKINRLLQRDLRHCAQSQ